ncbi:cyclin-P isoform X2 [Equus asinus]|uniref:cyclin-P isoform X2 n=1 Tax=Equus asinus TaxID=9793 RepID=UPI0038F741AA
MLEVLKLPHFTAKESEAQRGCIWPQRKQQDEDLTPAARPRGSAGGRASLWDPRPSPRTCPAEACSRARAWAHLRRAPRAPRSGGNWRTQGLAPAASLEDAGEMRRRGPAPPRASLRALTPQPLSLAESSCLPRPTASEHAPRRRRPRGHERLRRAPPGAVRAAGAGGGAERAGAGGRTRVRRGHLRRGHGVPRAAQEGPAEHRDRGDARARGGLAGPGARVPGPGRGHALPGRAPARFLPARGPSAPTPPAAAGRGLPLRGVQDGRVRASRARLPLPPGRRLLLAGGASARRAPHPEPPGFPAAPPGPAAVPRAAVRAGPERPPAPRSWARSSRAWPAPRSGVPRPAAPPSSSSTRGPSAGAPASPPPACSAARSPGLPEPGDRIEEDSVCVRLPFQ